MDGLKALRCGWRKPETVGLAGEGDVRPLDHDVDLGQVFFEVPPQVLIQETRSGGSAGMGRSDAAPRAGYWPYPRRIQERNVLCLILGTPGENNVTLSHSVPFLDSFRTAASSSGRYSTAVQVAGLAWTAMGTGAAVDAAVQRTKGGLGRKRDGLRAGEGHEGEEQ
jgi:hypothetical protein